MLPKIPTSTNNGAYDFISVMHYARNTFSTNPATLNTIQPLLAPFSPGTVTAKRLLINNTNPSQPGYTQNIGNRLDDAHINWRWYSGGWNDALANNQVNRNA